MKPLNPWYELLKTLAIFPFYWLGCFLIVVVPLLIYILIASFVYRS